MGADQSRLDDGLDAAPYTPEYGKELDRGMIGDIFGEFDANYMGSVSVKEPTGNDVCADAITRIKALNLPVKYVKIIISSTGVYTVDRKQETVVSAVRIPEISFVSLDAMDKKVFSFICLAKELLLCHGFCVTKRAQEIPVVINQAFRTSARAENSANPKKLTKSEALSEAKAEKKAERAADKTTSMARYAAKYLGSVPVREAKGNAVVMDAVRRIKALEQTPRNVDIVINPESIDIVEAESHDIIKTVSIMEVSFTAFDPDDKRLFSYITNDSRLGLIYCHAFSVKNKAAEIPEMIGKAFEGAASRLRRKDSALMRLVDQSELEAPAQSTSLNVFEAKYIGFVAVNELRGEDVVHKAYASIKHSHSYLDAVVLVISAEGVRAVEGLTGEVIRNVFIRNISFTCVSGARKEIFAFISHDERLGRVSCHLYDCGPRAYNVCVAIGDAFKAAAAAMAAQKGNPFTASSAEREAVSGPLFTKQVHRKDLEPIKPIGAGQFGEVYLANWNLKDNKSVVAVKMLRNGASISDKGEFLREAETMASLTHENLVRMVGVAVQQRPWLCVLECMQYGDVRDVLQTCKEKSIALTRLEQLIYAVQIADGMAYMAENRFIHMDLAARNCLLHTGNVCKVADFGLTRPLDEGEDHYVLRVSAKLPVKWVSIEALDDKIFSEGSDIWAYGVLLWEILSYGAAPYENVRNQDIQRRVREGLRLKCPEGADEHIFRVASMCWHMDRYKRPSFKDIGQLFRQMLPEAKAACPPARDIGQEVARTKKQKE
uniref:Protein tyrosine kinase n=1 Tax=Monosiga ovata TaxID=81526 RepID=B3XVW1_9EUKA|nr:protein tyrosine kinase [Monosiga ovata]|eukprot:m.225408 g.225408  ORF g.225408 m.225408 type:complete len:774 (-) comp11260_c0_seq1:86-2407(-)